MFSIKQHERVIDPIDKKLLKKELAQTQLILRTQKGGNEIYITDHHHSPNIMLEIGRLREVTFREAGGGTKKSIDIDRYDTDQPLYQQLIVWNPNDEEIVGSYRSLHLKHILKNKTLSTNSSFTDLFQLSDTFLKNYAPYTLELGRSFIQPKYQAINLLRKSLYALDNLWTGLGYLIAKNLDVRYLAGKVTLYPSFDPVLRDMLFYLMEKHFRDKENLIYPHKPYSIQIDEEKFDEIFSGKTFLEDRQIFQKETKKRGFIIPPLVNAYIRISPTLKSFGSIMNTHFGNVEEIGILIKIDDIYPNIKERYITPHISKS